MFIIYGGDILLVLSYSNHFDDVKCISFDIDETITRWKNIDEFFELSLKELGIIYSNEMKGQIFKAMHDRELIGMTSGDYGIANYSWCLEDNVEALRLHNRRGYELIQAMFKREADYTYITEDCIETLEYLYEKYKTLDCFTNWFYDQAIKKIQKHHLEKYFSKVYASDSFSLKHKYGFDRFSRNICYDPKYICHVGDSLADVPSKSLGLKNIYLKYGLLPENITEEIMNIITNSDATITEFGDLKKVL